MSTQEPSLKEQSDAMIAQAEGQMDASDTTHSLAGATVERVYYAVRDTAFTVGTCFSDRVEAIKYAQIRSARSAAGAFGSLAPIAVSIDVRASFVLADGGGIDKVIETFSVAA